MNKRKIISLILLGIFFIGLSILLYPSVSNYWNMKRQSRAVEDYNDYVKNINPEDYSKIFEQAENYNKSLADLDSPLTEYTKLKNYEDTLNINDNGMIGYISIDKLRVELPIYHSTSDTVLSSACGHLEGSSFPIGGEGTHSVLSAHRGLPSAKLFSELDKLEEGDTFKITILDRILTYKVDQIRIVNPADINDIQLESDKDYCTLLTCTPYGINTHRLLVRGIRTEDIEEENLSITSDAYIIDKFIVTPAVALPILLLLIIYVFFKPIKRKLPLEEEGEEI